MRQKSKSSVKREPALSDRAIRERYLQKILNSNVYDVAKESPLEEMVAMSRKTGHRFFLKREDLQCVHSFKLRGAYCKMSHLPRAALEKGVLAASAGNHAQGVALSAKRLGCKATIVMPVTTPEIKVNAVKSHGAQVVLSGDSYSDAAVTAARLVEERKLTFIPPYDDEDVIAGQGTVAMEILRQHSGRLDAVFVPVGGGGFAAGVAAGMQGDDRDAGDDAGDQDRLRQGVGRVHRSGRRQLFRRRRRGRPAGGREGVHLHSPL